MVRKKSLGILIGSLLAMMSLNALPARGQDAPGPLKKIKTDKILFLGNSITLHAPSESIGWMTNWGMAASAQDKGLCSSRDSGAVSTESAGVKNHRTRHHGREHRRFRSGQYTTYPIEEKLKKFLDFKPSLAIVAIGENVPVLTSEDSKAPVPCQHHQVAENAQGPMEIQRLSCVAAFGQTRPKIKYSNEWPPTLAQSLSISASLARMKPTTPALNARSSTRAWRRIPATEA